MSGSGKQPKFNKTEHRRQQRFNFLTKKFGMEAAIRMMRPPDKQDKPLPLIFRISDVDTGVEDGNRLEDRDPPRNSVEINQDEVHRTPDSNHT